MALFGVALIGGCGGTAPSAHHAASATSRTETGAVQPAPTATATIQQLPVPAASGPTAPAGATRQGAASTRAHASGPRRPAMVQSPIPFASRRKAEMAAYALRHYGFASYRLIDPHVIVIHYTETPDFQSTFNVFAPDVPDSELHELPGTCAHFVIDSRGVIHQLVPLSVMCRHTVGLNWTAIGIEHVAYGDREVLENPLQMKASVELVRWLQCRFHIRTADVIGHNESLSSPYHHENVPALRSQTHSDFNRADMRVYRSRLRAAAPC